MACRASENRDWQRWRAEYDTDPINECDDECPHDNRPCPPDVSFCCKAFRRDHESLRDQLSAIREYYGSLGYEDVDSGPPFARLNAEES